MVPTMMLNRFGVTLLALLTCISVISQATNADGEGSGLGVPWDDDEIDTDEGQLVLPTRVIPPLQSPVTNASQGESDHQSARSEVESYDRGPAHNDMDIEFEPGSGDEMPFSLPPTPEIHSTFVNGGSPTFSSTPNLDISRPLPPQLQLKLKKLPAVAGRVTRWRIPDGTFFDPIQGNARNLSLQMHFRNGSRIPPEFWLHFDTRSHEVTLLPFDENMIGRWSFVVTARNKAGLEARDVLQVVVRQYPGSRLVNHMFLASLRDLEPPERKGLQKWKVLAFMVEVFRDKNLKHMLVRKITDNPVSFGWTNTSFLSSSCPRQDIEDQFASLQSQLRSLSSHVSSILHRFALTVEKLDLSYYGPCLAQNVPLRPRNNSAAGASSFGQENDVPVIRNPIDRINVTAGEMLRFQVPRDTCFDPDEGDSRSLTLQLLSVNRKELARHSWLQFNQANQEFIGVPLEEEVGRVEYQLVCSDSNGLSAIDGVEVLVSNRPFSEKINIEYVFQFSTPIHHKRLSIYKKLGQINHPKNVVLKSVEKFSVTWFDKEMNRDECNVDLIRNASNRYLDDKGMPQAYLQRALQPLELVHVKILSHRSCNWTLSANAPTDTTAKGGEDLYNFHGIIIASDYLLTFFVPVVIIFFMVVVALALAIALHRRRQAGKLNLFFAEAMPPRLPVILKNDLMEDPGPSMGLFTPDTHDVSEASLMMSSAGYDPNFVPKSRPAPAYLS